MAGRGRLRWLLVAGAVLLVLGVVSVRLLLDSRQALLAGERAEARGNSAEAIRHFQDAIRLYLPGSPYVRDALDRLEAMAAAALAAGEEGVARSALEAARGALLGTRSVYTPHASRLPEVERQLALLLARAEEPGVAPGADQAARTAWHAERLARRPGPALPHVLLALAGLALWVSGTVGFFTRGLDPGLRLRRLPAALAGAAFAFGMTLFLIGLRLA